MVRNIIYSSLWTKVIPLISCASLFFVWGRHDLPGFVLGLLAILLVASVLAAVQHAEVVAHRVGEPFGSLILAIAVTIIEVGLILMLMTTGSGDNSELARDSVFAAVMITMNGIVGLSLFVSASKFHLARFNSEGAGSALGSVILLTGLTLVIPSFTSSAEEGEFSSSQLVFAAVASLAVYGMFIFTQTVRHRDFFLPPAPPKPKARKAQREQEDTLLDRIDDALLDSYEASSSVVAGDSPLTAARWVRRAEPARRPTRQRPRDTAHAAKPSVQTTVISLVLLLASLVAVVGLAKIETPAIESVVDHFHLPKAVIGVVIALVILLPESISAVKAALRDRTQISLNLGYGSAMASIGLTIPAMAIASIWLEEHLVLGLQPVHLVLFATSAVVSVLTVVPGRAKSLHGALHLIICFAFIFLTVVP
ncbi:MAG: ionic transporter y4hA [Propionibacteriaceae bacterium]|jgi:Ca2+:H+ antiporter|nr:ionic transporter y4hA [Propionibacteriaceae bacterium]